MPASPTPSGPFAPSPPSPHPRPAWPDELEPVLRAALPDYLLRQRWYPAKDAGQPKLTPRLIEPFPVDGFPAAASVWRVEPPGRASLQLFIALALVPEDQVADPAQVIARLPAGSSGASQVLVEGFSLDAFVRAWVAMMVSESPPAAGSHLRSGRTQQVDEAGLQSGGQWEIRRSRAEQSNTSIRIGDGAIMKAIRKLEEGTHPELEVGRFLTGEARFQATPAMLAWAELDLPAAPGAAAACTLCVMQSFVPNQGDAWDWMLGKLAAAASGNEASLMEAGDWLETLAARTAQMHRAFGIATRDPAFAPEPVTDDDLRGWVTAVQTMARQAMSGLAESAGRLEPPARALVQSLRADGDRLSARLDALLQSLPRDFAKTRHHGDYHLGQVLVAGDDAVIVDFEGEPMRPLEERRAKHAALRDVAGLLRSVSYAAAAAARALPEGMPAAQHAQAVQRLEAWEREASQRFLGAYLEAAQGAAGCPPEPADALRLIHFFMLEKALYEVAYELANRPTWVDIPLRGIQRLLADGSDAGGEATAEQRS